jgi:ankyrin repeat protein
MLLDYGSEIINVSDNDGKTSLYYACQDGHLNIVEYLIEHKIINLNLNHVQAGHNKIVQLLQN